MNLALIDQTLLAFMHKLDGVFNREDVVGSR